MVISGTLATLLFRSLNDATGFHVPSRSEAAGARRMFAMAMSSPEFGKIAQASAQYGLEPGRIAKEGWQGLRFAEAGNSCEGRGVYILRDDADPVPVALMAPHRGADRWTGSIAALLFDEHSFAAAAWNSAPRRSSDGCQASGDVTRTETHFFTSFSLAFASRFPHGRIVQLHGFDRKLRKSASGRRADVILSNGSEIPDDGLLLLADCLGNALPMHEVSVFPFDTDELGALQNRQGQALRRAGFDGFVHVEIAQELRRALTEDRALRASLASCLATGTR
ncbi:MAG: hypothetical protein ACRCY3_08845 [Sphingorhabdus sp.]